MHLRPQRLAATLVPKAPGLRLDQIEITATSIQVCLTSTARGASCPRCAAPSSRVRSRYQRTLTDLPWSGLAVKLRLAVRRFACDVVTCPQRIFTERLTTLTVPYGRRTNRLTEIVRVLAFAAGGEAGSRLLHRLRMGASGSTLLRLIRRTAFPTPAAPQVVGIDEWARRGQTYGTLVVDLERRQPIDLLPDRTAPTVATWLQAYPSIEVISRDRAGAFAEGATTGAPAATQVADRFHVLRNLADTLERALQPHRTTIKRALSPTPEDSSADSERPALVQLAPARPLARVQAQIAQRRAERLERYTTVRSLHERGVSRRAIAAQVGLNVKTVQRWLRSDGFPELPQRPPRRSVLDPYKPYLLERWEDGCDNGIRLWREIEARGYRGGRTVVREFLARVRQSQADGGGSGPSVGATPPTPRELVWYVLRRPERRTTEEEDAVTRLRAAHVEIDQAVQFVQEFATMVRERQPEQLEPWLWRVANSELAALRSFAAGIQRDKAAVLAGLTLDWSQGQVEGQITRLKLLKRAMYGRAKDDLLKQRVLYRG